MTPFLISGCVGLLCPCVVFGWNVEQLEGDCCCPCIMHVLCTAVGCISCYASGYRTRIRAKYNLVVRLQKSPDVSLTGIAKSTYIGSSES